MAKSISELIMEYFEMHPGEELTHGPIVDWVTRKRLEQGNSTPRDVWRATRRLSQQGRLIKVRKGVYKYDPDIVKSVELMEFSQPVRRLVLERDNYLCIVCGRGRADGVEVAVDHKIPLDRGGNNSPENGQTLCTQHNLLKKNYSQTEAGKRYFIRMYEDAVVQNDENMIKFCQDVFDVYDRHDIDRHIARPDE